MSVFWGLIWGMVTVLIMMLTMKYYLPVLSRRAKKAASEVPETLSGESEDLSPERETWEKPEAFLLADPRMRLFIWICCALFACFCGYSASEHAVSGVSLLRMTLTYAVLCCVFITDLEFYLIPNLCSVALLAARGITVILELILLPDSAMLCLIDSIVALVICLILLLIMALITRGGIGMGDVKLFSCIGFMSGIRAVCFTLVIAFLACAMVSTVLLLMKKRQPKDVLPMGPFIWIGFGVSVLLAII